MILAHILKACSDGLVRSEVRTRKEESRRRIAAGAEFGLVCWLVLASCASAHGAGLVLLERAGEHPVSHSQAIIAAQFYGLKTTSYSVDGERGISAAMHALRETDTVAALVSADALPVLDRQQVLSALRRVRAANIPLLVVDIAGETEPKLLKAWSDGTIVACQGPVIVGTQDAYRVTAAKDVARQLGGGQFRARAGETCGLVVGGSRAEPILTLPSGSGQVPVFVRTLIGRHEVFFSAGMTLRKVVAPASALDESEYSFSAIAPLMMFVRYAAGDRAWHSDGHYANLTVDDAWLREPYGHVRYVDLLKEMQRHNFHTTLAFIPWNFDRSEPEVAALFRAQGDRFSICVHGNNHDHQEFGSLQEKPLSVQIDNIRQGLARMEAFTKITGIPYDKVMVFPHSIAPSETLGALKRYNFLATVDSRNIPLGSDAPAEPQFALRPITLDFACFPSVRRYSAEIQIPRSELAVDAFLDNPILFYVHEAFFADGIDRFDTIADSVNEMQPGTRWRGLSYILEHSYLERQREDDNYDILAFTSNLEVENTHMKDALFYIQKEENFEIPFQVFVDGHIASYSRDGNLVRCAVLIEAGKHRRVEVRYQGHVNTESVDISKSSIRVATLRYLSDFRDNVVSRTALGRQFTRAYTAHESGMSESLAILVAFCVLLASGCFIWRRTHRLIAVTGPEARNQLDRHLANTQPTVVYRPYEVPNPPPTKMR